MASCLLHAPEVGGYFEKVWRGTNTTPSQYLILANIPGSTLSSQETWRQTHFGTYNNAGNTADTADFDLDGLPNLLEYAFGLNPTQGVSRALPVPQVNGSNYVVSFTQPVGVSGVTYGAEWSTTLAPVSWVSIPNTGTAPQYTFSLPLSGNTRVFVRLRLPRRDQALIPHLQGLTGRAAAPQDGKTSKRGVK